MGGAEHFSPVVSVLATGALSFSPNPVLDRATFTNPAATHLTVSLAALPTGVYSVTNEATHRTMRPVKANQR